MKKNLKFVVVTLFVCLSLGLKVNATEYCSDTKRTHNVYDDYHNFVGTEACSFHWYRDDNIDDEYADYFTWGCKYCENALFSIKTTARKGNKFYVYKGSKKHSAYNISGKVVSTGKCDIKWMKHKDTNGVTYYIKECKICRNEYSDHEFDNEYYVGIYPWKNSKSVHGITINNKTLNGALEIINYPTYESGIKNTKTTASREGAIYAYRYNKKTGRISFKLRKRCTVTYRTTMKSGAVYIQRVRYK